MLEQEFEREPTAEELGNYLEISSEEVASTLLMGIRHVSVDSPLSDGEDNTLIDVLINTNASSADERLDHFESLKMDIERSLQTLTQRQRDVLCYFYGIGCDHPLSLEDIGERYNLTRERVRQIKDKAINKLRATNRCRQLKTYLR
jgi:RNA polymerase primary sigma factor